VTQVQETGERTDLTALRTGRITEARVRFLTQEVKDFKTPSQVRILGPLDFRKLTLACAYRRML
jgi:hypothetical protein